MVRARRGEGEPPAGQPPKWLTSAGFQLRPTRPDHASAGTGWGGAAMGPLPC